MKHFYMAINMFGPGRAFTIGNGWWVKAYKTKRERDNAIADANYEKTAARVVTWRDIRKLYGSWKIVSDNTGAYDVQARALY